MLKIQTKALSIVTGKDHPHLSKEQKAFNTLIKKIDEKRASLAAWQEIIPAYQSRWLGYCRAMFPSPQYRGHAELSA